MGRAALAAAYVPEGSGDEAICKLPAGKLPSGLYVVSVPIGNLGDITLRALDVLSRCELVAAEDTRNSGLLLKNYGIKQRFLSFHDHSAEAVLEDILGRLAGGAAVALVSDAGTPVVSDPGFELVRACQERGLPVYAVPGASAMLAAVTMAGIGCERFLFAGFLPQKKSQRQKMLLGVKAVEAALIFYETAPRLRAALADMVEVFGAARPAFWARELTKLYEESRCGSLGDLLAEASEAELRGEFVLVVGRATEFLEQAQADERAETASFGESALQDGSKAMGNGAEVTAVRDLLRQALAKMSVRDAVAMVVAQSGIKRKEVYALALALHKGGE